MSKLGLWLVIFGANGPTGQILTRLALLQGYCVTAVTRRPEQFEQQHPNLRVVYGNVYDLDSVTAAIKGQDVVVSLIGLPFSWKPVTIYSQSAIAIVESMQVVGMRRLLFTSSGGTNPNYDPTEGFIFGRIIKPTIGYTTYKDLREAETIVMQSNMDWTILRPAWLANHPTVTAYHCAEGYVVPGKLRTARTDLADFLLSEIIDNHYNHKAVAIASDI
jgi:uncharacterized protein YbjT (DUF2867 family)